jgi:hypothetical protein
MFFCSHELGFCATFIIFKRVLLGITSSLPVYVKKSYRPDDQGLGIFLALGPTQSPIQWVPGALSLEVK